jgi:uncharacterized protein (TIGR02217 family)
MSGYHPVILPGKYSEGSVYAVGFDTRVTELENGQEERMVRYAPGGRRKYQIARGINNVPDVEELYRFFIARAGAANSFKFFDVMDHSTTPTNTSPPYSDVGPTNIDQVLQPISGSSYQCVTSYDDGQGYVVTRPITKLKLDVHNIQIAGDGISIEDADFTADPETGVVTIDPEIEFNTATWGGDYYTPVRFSQATDEAFRVSMPASKNARSLPQVELVEEIAPAEVSQDFPYGGAYYWAPGGGATSYAITPLHGRVQTIESPDSAAVFTLPPLIDMPEGGPLLLIRNGSQTTTLNVTTADQTPLVTININNAFEFYVARFLLNGQFTKYWIVRG